MDLESLQLQHRHWLNENFPHQTSEQALFGVVEEVGELAHAHLKGQQGIRHMPEEILAMKIDAIGDIVIFLDGYCYGEGLSFPHVVSETWKKVRRRNWNDDKQTGGE